ncbi:hypothetical protein [Cupriavidus basilensis]|uniref:hypothetical protein n=1 Tax=Cupriavidus basilensis TaxID=68895 RepID=UPI00284DE49C|nr:hypothetical protein [Cupriavidus basilensis]MDR3382279.1 hypothetical protein [Cupriavidus basilensis]
MSLEKWGWASVVSTAGAAVALFAFLMVKAGGMDSGQNQAIAAWVQAIGSIGAIAAGFAVVHTQNKFSESVRQRENGRRRIERFNQVLLMASDACEAIDCLHRLTEPEEVVRRILDPDLDSRTIHEVELVRKRLDGNLQALATVLRIGDMDLHQLQHAWKLQSILYDVTTSLAGINNPGREFDAAAKDRLRELCVEAKKVRFFAGISVAHST